MARRAGFLRGSDEELLAQCEVDRYRASGPGGQKRNKTESAIRIRHKPSGVSAIANESRSQHDNKAKALRRLRVLLAVEFREDVNVESYTVPAVVAAVFDAGLHTLTKKKRAGAEYLLALGAVIDLFVAAGCSMGDTARLLGVSTNGLTQLIRSDETALRKVNELRSANGLKPLR